MDLVIACPKDGAFRLSQKEKSDYLPVRVEFQSFWCWLCGHLFACNASTCAWEDVSPHIGKTAYRTQFQCEFRPDAENRCEAPVLVNTIVNDTLSPNELVELARNRGMKGTVTCRDGHEVGVLIKQRNLGFRRILAEDIYPLPSKRVTRLFSLL